MSLRNRLTQFPQGSLARLDGDQAAGGIQGPRGVGTWAPAIISASCRPRSEEARPWVFVQVTQHIGQLFGTVSIAAVEAFADDVIGIRGRAVKVHEEQAGDSGARLPRTSFFTASIP